MEEALAAYQAGKEIRERLAGQDSSNAGWARDVAVSEFRVGAVAEAQGDKAAARAAFAKGREIVARLAAASPTDATLKKDLAWVEGRLAALDAEG